MCSTHRYCCTTPPFALEIAWVGVASAGAIQECSWPPIFKWLVGYWPFCGNVNDESGNGNNGTVNGANTTDRFGNLDKAYSFDGVSNDINLGNVGAFDFGGNDFSVSIWVFKEQLVLIGNTPQ